MGHPVHFVDGTEGGMVREGEPVLNALERCGHARVPVGCRGGGCGVCKVRVLKGAYTTGRMSRAHVSVAEEGEGFALACRLYADGPLVIEAIGKCVRVGGFDIRRS